MVVSVRMMSVRTKWTITIRMAAVLCGMLAACLMALPVHAGHDNQSNTVYAVHIASFRGMEGVTTLMSRLKGTCDPFYRRVTIPGKGNWYRFYAGAYEKRDEAETMGLSLKEAGIIDEFFIHEIAPEPDITNKAKAQQEKRAEPETPGDEKVTLPASHETSQAITVRRGGLPVARKKIGDVDDQFDEALGDIRAGRYDRALTQLLALKTHYTEKGKDRERLARRIADCYFHLGTAGDSKQFVKAAESYRQILRDYPDRGEENALALYRLGQSYERMNLHYEAMTKYTAVLKTYPDDDHADGALFGVGKMAYMMKKYQEAIKHLTRYLETYPGGAFARECYFFIGDCYAVLKQFDEANSWYNKGLQKVPDLEKLPKEIMLKAGNIFVSAKQYGAALDIFLTYLNLYPDDEKTGAVICHAARCFDAVDEPAQAVKILSILIDRYPESRDAKEGSLLMADLGLNNPGMPMPAYIVRTMEHYEKPLETYDAMAEKSYYMQAKEKLMYRKGKALFQLGRKKEAFETFVTMLNAYPYGYLSQEARDYVVKSIRSQVLSLYAEGNDEEIARIYFKTRDKKLVEHGDFDLLFAMGNSLKRSGLSEEAIGIFQGVAEKYGKEKRVSDVKVAMGAVNYYHGNYKEAKTLLTDVTEGKSTENSKNYAAARELLGDIFAQEENYTEAVHAYSDVLSLTESNTRYSELYKKLAACLEKSGYCPAALVHYRKALAYAVDRNEKTSPAIIAETYEGLGSCLLERGDYAQAIAMFHKGISQVSEPGKKAWMLFNVWKGYMGMGDYAEADITLAALRETGDAEFWDTMTSFYFNEFQWGKKYHRLLERG